MYSQSYGLRSFFCDKKEPKNHGLIHPLTGWFAINP